MARRKAPHLPDNLLDQLLAGGDARAALDPGGLLDDLKKALAERVLNAEMDHHLSREGNAENRRNGYGSKTGLTDTAKLEIAVPRGRQAALPPPPPGKQPRGRVRLGAGRSPPARDSRPQGPAGDPRPPADWQVPAALPWLRRQDHLDVCQR